MRIDIITCVPSLLESPLGHSILKRAQDNGIVTIVVHDLRDYSINKQRQIDDYPYGGEAGMVLRIEPFATLIRKLQEERTYDEVIYLTPDGNPLIQNHCNELSICKNLIMLAGHYKGIDQRIRDLFVTREISIGDYVLTGGELAAAVLVDSIVRLIPGVISDESSALSDSFQDDLLAPPVYTRPFDFEGNTVPDILLSGHKKNIEDWRLSESILKTTKLRPDLLDEPKK